MVIASLQVPGTLSFDITKEGSPPLIALWFCWLKILLEIKLKLEKIKLSYMSVIQLMLEFQGNIRDHLIKEHDFLETDPDAGHVVISALAVFIPYSNDQTLLDEVNE